MIEEMNRPEEEQVPVAAPVFGRRKPGPKPRYNFEEPAIKAARKRELKAKLKRDELMDKLKLANAPLVDKINQK